MPKIAVIGGGPKGVAIAAKASVLSHVLDAKLEVDVFERHGIGASWSGNHGFTDGQQLLCTPAEKDLGFPYAPFRDDRAVPERMMADFSWGVFNSGREGPARRSAYSEWVTSGRKPCTHGGYAEYLSWAFQRSGAKLVAGRVDELVTLGRGRSRRWQVRYEPIGGRPVTASGTAYDGVVVTHHGDAERVDHADSARLFDGRSFWSSREQVLKALKPGPRGRRPKIVVVGNGGTAAAVLSWLARNGFGDVPISILGGQPTFYSRGDSAFENRLFDDPDRWSLLSTRSRIAFTRRLTRGVVWQKVMDDLAELSAVQFVEGHATFIEPEGAAPDALAKVIYRVEDADGSDQARNIQGCSLVVDAIGFNAWWFLGLLPREGTRARAEKKQYRQRLEDSMGDNLEFRHRWELPPLHAPQLSAVVGPGLGSLLALGDMADRILGRYA